MATIARIRSGLIPERHDAQLDSLEPRGQAAASPRGDRRVRFHGWRDLASPYPELQRARRSLGWRHRAGRARRGDRGGDAALPDARVRSPQARRAPAQLRRSPRGHRRTSFLLELTVYPAIFAIWKQRGRRRGAEVSSSAQALLPTDQCAGWAATRSFAIAARLMSQLRSEFVVVGGAARGDFHVA
jgi:hypothetical protein